MNHRSTSKRTLTLVAILAMATGLLAQTESREKLETTGIFGILTETPETAQVFTQEDVLILQLERAHEAARAGDVATAEALFRQVRASAFPWHSWAATSGLVATYRMNGEDAAAFAETTQISEDKPQLRDLMSLWDGDTAVLAGDLSAARAYYSQAVREDAPGVAAAALNQLARLALLEELPQEAAELKREQLRRFPGQISPEMLLAEAMALDAMASGQLPPEPLSILLHGEECTDAAPCLLQDGRRENFRGEGMELAKISGLRFLPSPSDLALLATARHFTKESRGVSTAPLSTACTPSTASDGFRHPLGNEQADYEFMEPIAQGYHPGLDITGPGSCNDDCGTIFVAVARGCVRDASPSNWGSATIEHYYLPDTWVSQYGHASEVYYSAGAAISQGASLGKVGAVGGSSSHLHHELREADHPNRTSADYYSNLTLANVGDWYQNPLPFYDAHRGYSSAQWADEGAFTRHGAWSYVSGVGDRDDMRWAWSTPSGSKSNYAHYSFTAHTSGSHELWVFIPYNYATSSRANYRVVREGDHVALLEAELDQLNHSDAWVHIGSIPLTADFRYTLEVASNTGESGRRVGLDDVLLIKP